MDFKPRFCLINTLTFTRDYESYFIRRFSHEIRTLLSEKLSHKFFHVIIQVLWYSLKKNPILLLFCTLLLVQIKCSKYYSDKYVII